MGSCVSAVCWGDVVAAVVDGKISILGSACFVEWNKSGGGYGVSSSVAMRYKAVNTCWYTP